MSELAAAMPQVGGGYLFIVKAFGPMLGSVMGGCLWLSLIFASAFYTKREQRTPVPIKREKIFVLSHR